MTPDRIAETRRLVALLAQTTNPYLVEAVGELLEEVERQAGLDEEVHAYGLQVARLQERIRGLEQELRDVRGARSLDLHVNPAALLGGGS